MSSVSLRRASAQFNATSSRTSVPSTPSRHTMRARPSAVPEAAIQAPIESTTCSFSASCTGLAISSDRSWARKAANCSRAAIDRSELFGACGVAQIGVGEQRIERQRLFDQALDVGVAPDRLQVLAVGGGEAIGPWIAPQNLLLFFDRRAHPGERDHARIGNA